MRGGLPLLLMGAALTAHAASTEIEAFNRAWADATRRIDNTAALALWEDDGVSLLPSTPPIVGKPAIAKMLDDIAKQVPGAHMRSFELQCHDIKVSGDWASEWCTEHQVVEMPNGKPPFDGRGKLLVILHRGADGHWRLQTEMWNQA
ncbi:MAG: DUF4440 domain-containing protein [Xanthomonadaceae bacterium]|nr:DUF4440 domain-containing protein [Xanthomonadaceae bacterium]MDE1886101.1 DUF4440 domain-containing protein [Xanthomonadaceae bacterium]MDE1961486.1 DUF4440 domain-containing protein [Xanthomonadaceae bacterium]MDE2083662.1 DUF4440 domain-containing protein [Xanthomonadaceae bacterium]MDE2257893.1 DUF4440 domain-containing protein [Xanthomonadaceae bacterium]